MTGAFRSIALNASSSVDKLVDLALSARSWQKIGDLEVKARQGVEMQWR